MSTGNICTCGHDWDWHSPQDDSEDGLPLVCDVPGCACVHYERDKEKSDPDVYEEDGADDEEKG